jgi:hypothetical protein
MTSRDDLGSKLANSAANDPWSQQDLDSAPLRQAAAPDAAADGVVVG